MQQLEKQVGHTSMEDTDLTCYILSLEHKNRELLDLSSALAKLFSTLVYKLKDCSVIRLLLHQPKG